MIMNKETTFLSIINFNYKKLYINIKYKIS